jgi:predicted transcriptional regulator
MWKMNSSGSNPSTKRRDKLYIIAEILEISKEGSLKTQIMYRANLSFTQLNDYLKFMLKINLLEKILVNDKDTYRATAKGLDFLQRYNEITELIKSEEESNGKNGIKIPPQHLLKRSQTAP